jgi:hypothetical protein
VLEILNARGAGLRDRTPAACSANGTFAIPGATTGRSQVLARWKRRRVTLTVTLVLPDRRTTRQFICAASILSRGFAAGDSSLELPALINKCVARSMMQLRGVLLKPRSSRWTRRAWKALLKTSTSMPPARPVFRLLECPGGRTAYVGSQ